MASANKSNLGCEYSNIYDDILTVVPSDTLNLSGNTSASEGKGGKWYAAIYVGGAGNITAVTRLGVTVVITAPPVGSIIPIAVVQIKATGTTCTNMLAMR